MSLEEARTLAFSSMVAFEWFKAFNARSDHITVFRLGLLRNRLLLASITVAVGLQLAVIYVPFLQAAFDTQPMSAAHWGIVLLAGFALLAIEETRKMLFPRLFALGKWQPLRGFQGVSP